MGLAGGLAGRTMAQATPGAIEEEAPSVSHNISALQMRDWRDFFPNLRNGAILCDVNERALHFWSEDESTYFLFPTTVPRTDELTKRGRTEIVRKAENPTWTTTPSQRERFPDWPHVIPGGVPENPLGVRAMYLSWPAYLLHGTHDTRKVGRRSSDGCIGMFNEHALQLYDMTKIGTQVVLL